MAISGIEIRLEQCLGKKFTEVEEAFDAIMTRRPLSDEQERQLLTEMKEEKFEGEAHELLEARHREAFNLAKKEAANRGEFWADNCEDGLCVSIYIAPFSDAETFLEN